MLQRFSKLFITYILVLKPESSYFSWTVHNEWVAKRIKYSSQNNEVKTHIDHHLDTDTNGK